MMELTEIGYFSKTHGVKGQLVLKQDCDFNEAEVKVIFLETNGSKVPYFVKEFKEAANHLVVGLEEVDAVEKARLLCGKPVFIETRFIVEAESDESWLGFELVDAKHGSLGLVQAVTDNGQQVLLSFNYQGREVILPLVDDFIQKTDPDAKKIWYSAPEGLIDLYLDDAEEN